MVCAVHLLLVLLPVGVEVPADFLSKNLQANEGRPLCYPSYLGLLAMSNALSHNVSSGAVLLGKSLKSP